MANPKPTLIVSSNAGFHNDDFEKARRRLRRGKSYRDLSTVAIIPSRGDGIPARVVDSWMSLMPPMNQIFVRLFIERMEVGDAYNAGVETVLNHPFLSKFKYILTLEEDNLPPPDGLLRLYEHIDDYAAVGGLYWTKGEDGQPMIYGDPKGILNFVPQVPKPDSIQECNGLGMGFTLFRTDLFRDKKLRKPWFKTVQEWSPASGGKGATQDLHFFEKARKAGYRVACDTRVRVGHLDKETGIVW